MRLRTHLLVPMLVGFSLLGALGLGLTYELGRAGAVDDAAARMAALGDRHAVLLQDEWDDRLDAVGVLAAAKQASDLELALVNQTVKPFLVKYNLVILLESQSRLLFHEVSLVDAVGRETLKYVDGQADRNQRDLVDRSGDPSYAYLRDHSRSPPTVHIEPAEGVATLVFAAPLSDERDQFQGYVWATVPLDQLAPDDRLAGFPTSGFVGVYDREGRRLDAPGPTLPAAARPGALRPEEGVRVAGAIYVGGGVTAARSPQGTLLVYAVAEVAMAEVLGPIESTLAMIVAVFAAAVLVLAGLVLVVVGSALGPLEAVAGAVVKFSAGELGHRVAPRGGDELRALATGVNRMAASLAEREAALQREAESRSRVAKFATLGSVSAGVAHEINNPLGFIKANEQLNRDALQRLRDDPALPAAVRPVVGEILGATEGSLVGVERIARIVSALRQLAKPGGDALQPVALNDIVDSALTLAGTRMKNMMQVESDLAVGLPPVLGNADELGQVLLNLLINAAEAVPPEGGRVSVRSVCRADRVEVAVEDNGPGIPSEVASRLFTPFYTTKPTGTGLGLSISQRIVEGAGGTLSFENVPGGGARFTVALPARNAALAAPMARPRAEPPDAASLRVPATDADSDGGKPPGSQPP